MDTYRPDRRDFLMTMTALGATALPGSVAPRGFLSVEAAGAPAAKYDPAASFEIKVSEVEFRRTAAGRQLMARIYQPAGAGPFPTMLDLHGGAWNAKDRKAEEPMDRALAASGVLVVAIDMTLAGEAPYPACIQDANYGVRWLAPSASARAELDHDSPSARKASAAACSSSTGRASTTISRAPRDTSANPRLVALTPASVRSAARSRPISTRNRARCDSSACFARNARVTSVPRGTSPGHASPSARASANSTGRLASETTLRA